MNNGQIFDTPGPRTKRRFMVWNVVGILLIGALTVWVLLGFARQGQLAPEKWAPFLESDTWRYYLVPGLRATLRAAAISVVLAFVFGIVFGLGRLSGNRLIRGVSGVVVEFFRAVPVLVLMLFCYSAVSITRTLPTEYVAFASVVVGLTLYNGSVIAELVRGGVLSVPRGQREAALAMGFQRSGSLWLVELPQALIAMLPSLMSQLVIILKDSGLGYLINYAELLRQSRLVGSSNANLLPALIVAAIIFIIVNNTLTASAGKLATVFSRRTSVRPAGTGTV